MVERPKVVRTWFVFGILTSTCASQSNGVHFFINRGAFSFLTSKSASHHNGLQFSIAHPTTWLRTRRFGKHWKTSTSRTAATKHVKNIVLHDLSTFSRTLIFFLLTLSLLPLSLLTLSLLTLLFSDCSHHCCCICP